MTSLTAQEFHARITSDTIVLDVRTPEEFAFGHIPNAINIDMYSEDSGDKLLVLDKEKTYLIYCRSGNRSKAVLRFMQEHGFIVFELDKGINEWGAQGYTLTS